MNKVISGKVWLAALAAAASVLVSGCGYRNVETPAGYVGYLTQGSIAGNAKFVGTQLGPTSSGLGFLYSVVNISVTPYTFDETFSVRDQTGVLAKDQLPMSFDLHVTFRINPERVKDFVERYTTLQEGDSPDQIVRTAYNNYIKQPARMLARKEVEKFPGVEVQNNISAITGAVTEELRRLAEPTPFEILNVVVGNIQYPPEVTAAIAAKIAAAQTLQTMSTQVEITKKEAEKREAEAEGIARAMETIKKQLTPEYIQYEAIKAQQAMVNSPNHTTIYIPVGPLGVPIVNTLGTAPAETTQK